MQAEASEGVDAISDAMSVQGVVPMVPLEGFDTPSVHNVHWEAAAASIDKKRRGIIVRMMRWEKRAHYAYCSEVYLTYTVRYGIARDDRSMVEILVVVVVVAMIVHTRDAISAIDN